MMWWCYTPFAQANEFSFGVKTLAKLKTGNQFHGFLSRYGTAYWAAANVPTVVVTFALIRSPTRT